MVLNNLEDKSLQGQNVKIASEFIFFPVANALKNCCQGW